MCVATEGILWFTTCYSHFAFVAASTCIISAFLFLLLLLLLFLDFFMTCRRHRYGSAGVGATAAVTHRNVNMTLTFLSDMSLKCFRCFTLRLLLLFCFA